MFSFPLFSASKRQARSGSASSGSSVDGTQRVWEVDPLHEQEDPVLRTLGYFVSTYAHGQPATLYFEPWLKHDCLVFVGEGDNAQEAAYPPDLLRVRMQRRIKEVCHCDDNLTGSTQEGTGRLLVRGHAFSLKAKTVSSAWGPRLVVRTQREGDALPDPVSAFPWITDFGCPMFLCRTEIDFREACDPILTTLEERLEEWRQWVSGMLGQRPAPTHPARIDLLGSAWLEESHPVRKGLYGLLRYATRCGATHICLLAGDQYTHAYTRVHGSHGSGADWSEGIGIPRGAAHLRRTVADLARRYPAKAHATDNAVGIAFDVCGHPLDVTITERRIANVPVNELPSDLHAGGLGDDILPDTTVFTVTIHDDSPEPPHWERNRRLSMEQAARGEEEPPSSSYGPSIFCDTGDCPPSRNWSGWLRSRLGTMGRSQAGNMTLEDARELALLLKAKLYEKALARAIPFNSGGPEAAMGIVPSCLVGLLELLLSRTREARASICDHLMHAGEDLVAMLVLAECCERLGDTGGEQEAMRRALELSSKAVSNLMATSELLEEHGLLKQAAFLYELKLKEDAVYTHSELALENERKYRPCQRLAHRRRLAWRYAQVAAQHFSSQDGLDSFVMPTEHGFAHEEKTREHGGMYWQDVEQPDGRGVRQYFPNYLNRFADRFRPDDKGIKSLSSILSDLGRSEDAKVFLFEAQLL